MIFGVNILVPIILLIFNFLLINKFVILREVRNKLYISTIVRLFLLIVIIIFIDAKFYPNKLLDMYPDQYFYIDTSKKISEYFRNDIYIFNVKQVVGLHNWLYSLIGGVLSYINGGSEIWVLRSFNFLIHTVIVIKLVNFKTNNNFGKLESNHLLYMVSFFPSFLIFSILGIRDIFIAYLILSIMLNYINKKKLSLSIDLIILYFLRRQFPMLIITSFVTSFLAFKIYNLSFNKTKKLLLLPVLYALAISVFKLVFPNYSYLISHLNIVNIFKYIINFFVSFFSIGFLFSNNTQISKYQIGLFKIFTPEVFLLPMIFIRRLIHRFDKFNKLNIFMIIILLLYGFGYYIEFSEISTRHFFVFYPTLILYLIITGGKIDEENIILHK